MTNESASLTAAKTKAAPPRPPYPARNSNSSSTVQRLVFATRPWSLPVVLLPGLIVSANISKHLLSSVVAVDYTQLCLFFLAMSSLLLLTNLLNSWSDFRRGIDTPDRPGSDPTIVHGFATPTECLLLAAVCFGVFVAAVGGLVPVDAARLRTFWTLVGVGLFLGVGYSVGRYSLKLLGLGDVAVYLGLGPFAILALITTSCRSNNNAALTSHLGTLILTALPVNMFINGIMHANNHRDRDTDAQAGGNTLAIRLGSTSASLRLMDALLFLPYPTLVLVSVVTGSLGCLLAFLSLPAARNARHAIMNPVKIATAAEVVAQAMVAFGVLQLIGTLLL